MATSSSPFIINNVLLSNPMGELAPNKQLSKNIKKQIEIF